MCRITSRLNFARTLGSMMMLGIMLFLRTTYVYADQVSLAWDANTESKLGGYRLYYGQASGNYTASVDVGNKTSYTLGSLKKGKTYYFAVKAYVIGKRIWSGFSNEVSKTIPTSSTAPTASFRANPTSGVAPLTVTFADTSIGTIGTRSWAFGDGSTRSATSGAKTYSTPGTYTMKLTVTGSGGSSTATKTIAAKPAAPVANFTASSTSGTAPLAVSFANSSTGNVTSYSWNFGDGSASTTQDPAHTYSTAGTYTVSLTATGAGGTNTHTRTDFVTVSSVAGEGSPAGLVAAYNFEEANGTTAVDASGKGNHGTISGASKITQGRFGKALSFDGVDDWVTVSDAASLDLTTGMTIAAWVYPTDSMTGWQTVLAKEQPGGWGAVYYLAANSDVNQPEVAVFTNDWLKLTGGPWLLPDTWVHLAGTFDGISEKLYVNGVELANLPHSGSIEVTDGALRIGGNSAWGEFFKGRIDEVRVYNRALSAAEIETDMNTAVANSSPPISFIGTNTVGPISDSLPAKRAQAFRNTSAKSP